MSQSVLSRESVARVTSESVKDSLSFVLNAGNQKSEKVLTDLTRVNEQHMFAAIIRSKLEARDANLAARFEETFSEQVLVLQSKGAADIVFKAAKRALRGLRLLGGISRSFAGEIRKFAVGKAQLDSKRDELSTRNITGKAGDTALRALKTALSKFEENSIATREEMESFKNLNRLRRGRKRA